MTTWTLQQVAQAERLWARLLVDDELIARDPETTKSIAIDEMAKQLTHMGHPLGIELHREDFEVQWRRGARTPWQTVGEMRWRPTTNTVELRGGHLDGQRYAVQKVGEPLRVPRPAATPWLDNDASSAEAAMTEMVDTYELIGWREDERVWAYACRS